LTIGHPRSREAEECGGKCFRFPIVLSMWETSPHQLKQPSSRVFEALDTGNRSPLYPIPCIKCMCRLTKLVRAVPTVWDCAERWRDARAQAAALAATIESLRPRVTAAESCESCEAEAGAEGGGGATYELHDPWSAASGTAMKLYTSELYREEYPEEYPEEQNTEEGTESTLHGLRSAGGSSHDRVARALDESAGGVLRARERDGPEWWK
jgi:hypothetical protein